MVINTPANLKLFEDWLSRTYGQDHWIYGAQETLDLCFPVGKNLYGIQGIKGFDFIDSPSSPKESNLRVHYSYTEISYSLKAGRRAIFNSRWIYISNKETIIQTSGEYCLFALLTLLAIPLYASRRPLLRMLRHLRRPQ